jgi:hypothetical protein
MLKLLWGLVVLAALAVGGLCLAILYSDVAAKMAIEHFGPALTGTTVSVDSVQVSLRSGRGAIRGLELGSPPGFGSRRSARVGEIRFDVDPATVTSSVTVVHEIVVDAPVITYERGGKALNLDMVRERIEAYVKRDLGFTHKFVVERLEIRGARVLMTNAALKGQGITFELPEIKVADVGKRQGGITASELAVMVVNLLQVRIAEKNLTQNR